MILPDPVLTGMLLLIQAVIAGEFYNNSKMIVDVDPYMRTLAKRDLSVSPIVLDAKKYSLYPTTILTIFRNPRLIGGMPPGIANFMLTQVLLAGLSKGGMVYPLFTREALKFIGEDYVSVVIDCSKDTEKRPCKPGYQKVIVKERLTGGECGTSNPKVGQRETTTHTSSVSASPSESSHKPGTKTGSTSSGAPASTVTSAAAMSETIPETAEEEPHN